MFDFSNGRKPLKNSGNTFLLAPEILYRMVYKTSKTHFARTLLSVHLNGVMYVSEGNIFLTFLGISKTHLSALNGTDKVVDEANNLLLALALRTDTEKVAKRGKIDFLLSLYAASEISRVRTSCTLLGTL